MNLPDEIRKVAHILRTAHLWCGEATLEAFGIHARSTNGGWPGIFSIDSKKAKNFIARRLFVDSGDEGAIAEVLMDRGWRGR